MAYSVKELFFTLQGEGANTGRPAVFCRFSGCNLWSGREKDRPQAVCNFCDTDFVGTDGPGGGVFATAQELAQAAAAKWPRRLNNPLVVCTGGEPLLQLDGPAIGAFKGTGFEVAIETNGTITAPPGIDWICVSPKAEAEMVQVSGDELKLVYPQTGIDPEKFDGLDFRYFFLQPMDGPHKDRNTALATEYCDDHPSWRLSLQTHKILGIP